MGPCTSLNRSVDNSYCFNCVVWLGQLWIIVHILIPGFLFLISVIEGLPTVFTEAMSLGVIPIGFDSFNAIYDMIDDGIDGFIIPDNNYEQYAETILRLAQNDTLRCRIAYKAQKRKNRYDIEQVGPLWMETFRKHGLIK